ncbi:sigma-70 family RNA polymerase sigma factor [Carboxylicivirga mesophila]|uniref:Sigma-70 family RNA polymerase sigma factor n=1 Tax=Carboxylicivirga mesophila TaxID=1166478 RepID=A0ABS5K657_9BACT|nr:sigma-70 family RNA polymerase sigma factor [Carboxylicivirga mesophila]MBS2210479.1 sigma-70 family RNA polymerase sigma factor [Carboxylicivirga mesophila]
MAIKWFKNKEKSDEQLLSEFQQTGNIDILGLLFERYMHLVYGVCLKYLKNREDAQDAVMELYEKLGKELLSKEVNNFKPWLYVVTKNHCLMQLRSQQTQLRKQKDFEKSELPFMESDALMHPNGDNWEPEEMDKRLQACLNKLREHQRACIELFYFKELCYQEISDNLNIDIKKVKSYIQNGKRNLKLCIESYSE